MTPPTVTPEEMIADLDTLIRRAGRDSERTLIAARDYIRQHIARGAAVAASAEEALETWIHDNHFGEKCNYNDEGFQMHSDECLETAFAAAWDVRQPEIGALKQRVGELDIEIEERKERNLRLTAEIIRNDEEIAERDRRIAALLAKTKEDR